MTRIAGLLSFLPQEFLPLFMVIGGILLILGLRNLAMSLFAFCGLMIVLPPVLEAVLNGLPEWAILPVMLFALITMVTFFITLLIGNKAWDEAKGHMAANVITWIFLLPFRLIGWILGGLFSRRR